MPRTKSASYWAATPSLEYEQTIDRAIALAATHRQQGIRYTRSQLLQVGIFGLAAQTYWAENKVASLATAA